MAIAVMAGTAACAREELLAPLNWVAPGDSRSHTVGISYGPDPRQRLDVYLPHKLKAMSAPVVVFWHGGSWQSGDKEYYRFVGAALSEQGFVTIIPNYRLAPRFPFPAFMHDAAMAVRWARDQAHALGGDGGRLFLSGHSAGGHIALLLGLDPSYLANVGLDRNDVAGIIAIAAPTGLENLRGEALAGVFPQSAPDKAISPVLLAEQTAAEAPPILLISGKDDDVIDPRNTARLENAIRTGGGQVTRDEYPDAGHLGLLLQFSGLFGAAAGVPDAIASFAGLPRQAP